MHCLYAVKCLVLNKNGEVEKLEKKENNTGEHSWSKEKQRGIEEKKQWSFTSDYYFGHYQERKDCTYGNIHIYPEINKENI